MIHYLTVHFRSPVWIAPQLTQLRRMTPVDFDVWVSIQGIDNEDASGFDHVYRFEGEHPDKLNALADEVSRVASPDDILIFIDGDAYPIADVAAALPPMLERYPLVGVQRKESLGDKQPHPCFTATTVRFWNDAGLDWSRGGTPWTNDIGRFRFDAGGRILHRLEAMGAEWRPLLRSNKRNLHPVLFGVYDDLVYHHGSSFHRTTTQVDRFESGALTGGTGAKRLMSLVRMRKRVKHNVTLSKRILALIQEDPQVVERLFVDEDDAAFEAVRR